MGMGTGTIKLSEIITEFGGANNEPNLRAYLKGASPVTEGGVPEHENNFNVPLSGTIKIGDFRSNSTFIIDKDFESDNWNSVEESYVDNFTPQYESISGIWNSSFHTSLGFNYVNTSGGTPGVIDVVGKSPYNQSLTATVITICDAKLTNGGDAIPDTGFFALSGDERASGWALGNGFISVSVNVSSTITTLLRTDSDVPNGTYDATNNITYWQWSGSTFGMPYTGGSTNTNIKFSVAIIT